jgi:hypothetical protein
VGSSLYRRPCEAVPRCRRAGGIYLFADRAAAEAYVDGPIVARMKANPDVREPEIRVFDVRQRRSEITRAPLPSLPLAAE